MERTVTHSFTSSSKPWPSLSRFSQTHAFPCYFFFVNNFYSEIYENPTDRLINGVKSRTDRWAQDRTCSLCKTVLSGVLYLLRKEGINISEERFSNVGQIVTFQVGMVWWLWTVIWRCGRKLLWHVLLHCKIFFFFFPDSIRETLDYLRWPRSVVNFLSIVIFLLSDKHKYMDLVYLVFVRYCYTFCCPNQPSPKALYRRIRESYPAYQFNVAHYSISRIIITITLNPLSVRTVLSPFTLFVYQRSTWW